MKVPNSDPTPKPLLNGATYDLLKKLVQVVLPAVGSLYFGLAKIWGLPASEEVVGTLAILATFFGVLLSISHASYNASDSKYDGKLIMHDTENGGKLFSLELNGNPLNLDQKKQVSFKVEPSVVGGYESSTPTD